MAEVKVKAGGGHKPPAPNPGWTGPGAGGEVEGGADGKPGGKGLSAGPRARSWPMWFGAVLLSVLSIILFLVRSPWGSSGGLLNLGHNMFALFGMDFSESAPGGVVAFFRHPYAMLSIAMFLGALAAALMSGQFAIRVSPGGELVKGLIGGILMGIGAIIGLGCTVSAFYSSLPALSAGAITFFLGLFIGTFIAVRYILWEMEHLPGATSGKARIYLAAAGKGRSFHTIAGLIVFILGLVMGVVFMAALDNGRVPGAFIVIGVFIGLVLQRSRFCIVAAIREPFLTGDSRPAAAVIAGLAAALAGFTVIKATGFRDEGVFVMPNFWGLGLVGGVIFGFGMTLAGGCTVGATWRAGEGHVKLWLALLGIILTMPLAAEFIRPPIIDVLPASMWSAVYLPDKMGYGGAVSLVLLFLVLWFAFVRWNDRTGKLSAM